MENIGVIRRGTINNRTLDFNGKPICRATANTNQLGTYIIGNRLYDNGRLVAVSSQENPQLIVTNIVKFGEVRLDTDGICINITLENYNKLYNREEVPGYKYFDPYDVYNIVDDVTVADTITYVREANRLLFTDPNNSEHIVAWPNTKWVLYNNVFGTGEIFEEDFEQNVKQYNSPYLTLRYFNPKINLGNTVVIPFSVDNYFAEYVQGITVNGKCRQSVTGPYTIEVRNRDDDNSLVRKTVYSGESEIETLPFNTIGNDWFTIRCVDSNGVTSAMHYMEVLVKDPEYAESLWEVDDTELTSRGIVFDNDFDGENDPDYPGDLIGVPVADLSAAEEAELDAWNDFVLQAYTNKVALNKLFEDALDSSISGGVYNGVKLPKHRYCVCDYANTTNDPSNIVLNNDKPKYYYCELIGEYNANNKLIGNTISPGSFKTYSEAEIMTDPEELFTINGSINYDSSAGKVFKTYIASMYISGTIRPCTELTSQSSNIYNGNVLYGPGKYYFVAPSPAKAGEPLTCPNNFILDLNESTIQSVHQYDHNGNGNCTIKLSAKDNVEIRNGRFNFGIDGYDWMRACTRLGDTNPHEHSTPVLMRGIHFCSFINVTFEGALGYGFENNVQVSETWVTTERNRVYGHDRALTPRDTSSGTPHLGSGIYDAKRLDENGELTNAYNNVETFVMSDTNIDYGTYNSPSDSDIGYMPMDLTMDTADTEYVYVGYTNNGMSRKSKRQEIFVFFYGDVEENGVTVTKLLKIVKSRKTWMIKPPTNATKVRVMGYGHSGQKRDSNNARITDESDWKYVGLYPARSSYGTEYLHCTILKARAAFVCGNERQIIYDDLSFIDVASPQVYKPGGIGTWTEITGHCLDLESGGPFGKYIAINNVNATITSGRSGTRSICLQQGECIQLTNSNVILNEWGVWSGLIKGNTFHQPNLAAYTNRAANVAFTFAKSGILCHKHVLYEDNAITAAYSKNPGEQAKCAFNLYFTIVAVAETTNLAYEDVRENWLCLRFTTLTGWESAQGNFDKIIWRNSKRINRYYGASIKEGDDIYID